MLFCASKESLDTLIIVYNAEIAVSRGVFR